MIKEHMAHADIDHSPQPHAEKSTSNTQASRMPQGSARKITANFNPMVLSEIHAAGNKDQRVLLSPGGMRPTVPRQSSRSQCTAVQHRSTGVRTAYHVPMMHPVATMDWLYPLSCRRHRGSDRHGWRFSDDAVADTAFRRPSAHGGGNRLALRRRDENGWHRDPLQEG